MGLIGGMARTAVVAGTATAVSNRVARRQSQRWAAQDAQYGAQYGADPYAPDPYAAQQPPPPPPGPAPTPEPEASLDMKLERLARLHREGVLSDDEFAKAKMTLLTS
jgi:hypothetical protein